MIKNKKDLAECLKIEKENYKVNSKQVLASYFGCSERGTIWRFQKALRKCEYYLNTNKKMRFKFKRIKLSRMSIKLGFNIPLNCFDVGLSIGHVGSILINGSVKVGKNCRIHINTALVATSGNEAAPKLGDNCFIGVGATLIGDITIGNDVIIGAGSVVTKSFDNNCTIAGNPARKIN